MNGNPQTEIYLNLTSCRAAKKETIIHAKIKSPRINVPDKTTLSSNTSDDIIYIFNPISVLY